MKFAKSLMRNQVPEWTQWYIDYKSLKKLIKQASEQAVAEGSVDDTVTAPFFYAVDRNAEMVESFYVAKLSDLSRRMRHIESRRRHYDAEELDELIGVLLELRAQLRKLQWYAEVNKRGFVKILKKFDKKVGTQAQMRYLSSKILILGFTNVQSLNESIQRVSEYLSELIPMDGDTQDGTDDLLDGLANGKLQPHRGSTSSLNSNSDSNSDTEAIRKLIDVNDSHGLRNALKARAFPQPTLFNLLVRAIGNAHAVDCITVLLHYCEPPSNSSDFNSRNVVHRAIIIEGRGGGATPSTIIPGTEPKSDALPQKPGTKDSDIAHCLKILFDALPDGLIQSMLTSPDQLLRTPLHYAARYGLAQTTKLLMNATNTDTLMWKDVEGQTAVDLAVTHDQPLTLEFLLERHTNLGETQLLLIASRLDNPNIITVLLSKGADVDTRNPDSGETSLHIASKYGHTDCVRVLLKHHASLELPENLFNWTPLFLAAVDGSYEIAKLLMEAGANINSTDISGWTAKEHAALRGHIELSRLFPLGPLPANDGFSSSEALTRRRKSEVSPEPIKTFGHRYLENREESLVLITIGSRDLRYNDSPVCLSSVPVSEAGKTQLDTTLSLKLHASGCRGEPFIVDLPITELGLATEPVGFYTKKPEDVQIFFDLIPTYSAKKPVLGRGIANLSEYSKETGPRLINLDKRASVPLLESGSLRCLGSVTYEVLVVHPFENLNMGIKNKSTYWRSLITSRVIGHRGLGKNTLSKTSLQLGENTVESFIQAANLGASYVEFDVQLTRDGVPVIYHDFLVGDSGFDLAMHSMTLDQFMNIHRPVRGRSIDSRRDATHASSIQEPLESASDKRSKSLHTKVDNSSLNDAVERMKFTRDFQRQGYKGNVPGMHIQSQFATLAELFKTLPRGLGFNIECKYPMLDEAESEFMDCLAPDLNYWVDTVLKIIYDLKDDRDIILSSFNPDLCIMLSLKQPSIPVLFLTESGTTAMHDVRASSLQEAIRFAKRWNLLGIVSAATPLIDCPRLVRVVKESGLVCFTYGTENNVPENARRQLKAGVDAVIVDSVLAIRKELTDHEQDVLSEEVTSTIDQAEKNIASAS